MQGEYKAYRRTNALDDPRPAVVGFEWIVTGPSHMNWATSPQLAFPDTTDGQVKCELLAQALNAAYSQGARDKAREIRHAYNDFIELMGEDE